MKILFFIILTLALIVGLDILSYKAINLRFNQIFSRSIIAKSLFFFTTALALSILIYGIIRSAMDPSNIFVANYFYTFFGVFVLFALPKFGISVFYLLDQVVFLLIKKQHYINTFGLVISGISFFWVLHGLSINKDNFQVRTEQFASNKIPQSFNGFKIIQISDLHIGSFHKNPKSIQKLVKEINEQKPDLIVFTGDLVSNYAAEVDEFTTILKQLKAKHGKYSIMGNHDYGEYVRWKSEAEAQQNIQNLKQKHADIDFSLLDNKNTTIHIEGESIQLIGVENWGLPPFPQYGNLSKSSSNIDKTKFTILLSHDPSHWRAEVINYPFIDLTLSGHTHAMQLGFELGSWQWSPVAWKYKEWGGLYKEQNQYLYVNRGTGFIGLPGRIGIRPEITSIILSKKK
jgi:hypothetical protein